MVGLFFNRVREPLDIFRGAHIELFFETGTEVLGIIKPHGVREVRHAYVPVLIHDLASCLHPDIGDEGGRV